MLPAAFAPVDGPPSDRPVVLAGAGGPAGARLGHVDLVDPVEAGGPVGGQHAGQSGSEAGTDHQVDAALAGLVVEREQGLHVVDVVAGRDHVLAGADEHGRLGGLGPTGTGEHDDVGVDRVGHVPMVDGGGVTQAVPHQLGPADAVVTDDDLVDVGGDQLAGQTGPDSAERR